VVVSDSGMISPCSSSVISRCLICKSRPSRNSAGLRSGAGNSSISTSTSSLGGLGLYFVIGGGSAFGENMRAIISKSSSTNGSLRVKIYYKLAASMTANPERSKRSNKLCSLARLRANYPARRFL
jgi:hypothetical protein